MTATSIDRTETKMRAAARRRGLTMGELAAKIGVSLRLHVTGGSRSKGHGRQGAGAD